MDVSAVGASAVTASGSTSDDTSAGVDCPGVGAESSVLTAGFAASVVVFFAGVRLTAGLSAFGDATDFAAAGLAVAALGVVDRGVVARGVVVRGVAGLAAPVFGAAGFAGVAGLAPVPVLAAAVVDVLDRG
ncbi:hypothetical protein GCM10027413_25240 [Conyzicola nivalis]|uniref:Uncharacterized protein n=1 Tax=Conyzicola nivalis TaxID=1477021 RepID=A0A916WE69_9MICO|nr:hypothetical protein [Conyzicola nivalis]GGA90399.1 hypothetical protein GCM10010979_01370 [Conyzicola nivalis]